eukprot:TRINITY_DN29524_c0_g1_i2.p1 TRINITY_DN29524_c0_g1~~TRINITY_DN29524_c0_g1_i2.p1  ORF type:complete len:317 (+),score=55.15 TRINITY_DN29524_c0_g1_i2:94-951(+)
MPTVLCGLPCFDAPALSTAGAAAQEFFSSLNSALEGAVCAVEVYRLERLEPEAQLAAEDTVVCYVPGWGFDFSSLEDLHNELEELRGENDTLLMQNSRTNEVLVSLNYAVEAAEAAEAGQRLAEKSRDSYREVVQLKQQLARSERKQQETKATVIALRSEFMQLVGMLTDTGAPANPCGMEVPNVLKTSAAWTCQSPHATCRSQCVGPRARRARPAVVASAVARTQGLPPGLAAHINEVYTRRELRRVNACSSLMAHSDISGVGGTCASRAFSRRFALESSSWYP